MKKYGLIIMLFIIAITLVIIFSKNDSYIKLGNLYISEIVASNNYTYKDNDGEYSDYIEIHNGNNYDVNLSGYRLTDSVYEVNKWKFSNITIKAHSYLLVFASGKNKCKNISSCHTNFKLSKDGETISLIDSTGNIISRVVFKDMENDCALSYLNGKYIVTIPTPGKENNGEEIKKTDTSKIKIIINEYLSHNKGDSYNSSGEYSDWVELYNMGEDISLKGLALSDDVSNLNKFMLPDKIIKKGEYLIINLNGGKEIEGEISATFKLSEKDKKLVLSSNGKIIDEVNIVPLEKNMSYGKSNGKWLYFYKPTKGSENNTYGVEGIDDNGGT